ncbi:hypothetical protein K402DRAFT_405196 [Aulographum hederae CBS 113979]|uniref:Malic enzyme n=1 Tax=Aulographum hederae CBS 113979 TaxID=1176131 RepID=A0A6G1GX70_9PEZI|nr:hypothetical protein K402DRAFT_405196 [Aulographum hederae CBS 113979]
MSAQPHANIKHHVHMSPRQAQHSSGDYDSSYPKEVRKYLKTYGLTPPAVEDFETQEKRCMALLEKKSSSIEKFIYLTQLRATHVHLFYRLLASHVKPSRRHHRDVSCVSLLWFAEADARPQELTPFIYTPTVGEACQKWSEIFTQPEGMYLNYWTDKGRISSVLQNWPHNVEITVITDGSRILGLGDLGINGMGIPVGKLALYTACAGIRPDATLPLCLDLGTNNKEFREDPLYLGTRKEKVSADEEREFLDELMAALTEKWPGIVIQYEDFKNPFPSLERYRDTYTMFNDDIQGTGAVILGGMVAAVKYSKIPVKDHRAIFLGSGSAGVGVAKQIVEFFIKEGLTEDEARRKFWLVDSKGLVTNDRGDKLAEHKEYFSRDDNNGKQIQSLSRLVDFVKPTIIMGLSTIGGAFSEDIIKKMAELNEYPIIFPLSNPSSKSECTFEEAVNGTDGKVLFASGSPFNDYTYNGKTLTPGQGNNMYVFPGIGLGAILSKAVCVSQEMIYASAIALSESLNEEEHAKGWLYPDIRRIREVSVLVTRGVIRAAQKSGVDRELAIRNLDDEELIQYIETRMYDPFKERDRVLTEVMHVMGDLATPDRSSFFPNGTNGHASAGASHL